MPLRGIICGKSNFMQEFAKKILKYFLTFIRDLLGLDSCKKRYQKSHATVPLKKTNSQDTAPGIIIFPDLLNFKT
jgi:hypothetical protein